MTKIRSIVRRLLRGDPNMAPNICYGQDGEDLIMDRILERKATGFYVDVGAHHPVRFSNTYLFYKRGWQGINIDAMPGSMAPFNHVRPRDINIECGVGSEPGVLNFHRFNEPALNTFDPAEAELKNKPPYHLIDKVAVNVERLDTLLARHVPVGRKIDFMSVDVEGRDEDVLRSNDWNAFRPNYVLAETLRTDLYRLADCPIVAFLGSVGYKPIAKAYNTSFFKCEDNG